MFKGKRFIYCADAGLGSLAIRKYNSMGGRAYIVTQSVKKLSDKLQKAVFNDYDYRRLSDNSTITIKHMKEFDRFKKENLPLYNDTIYKVINADRAVDVGLYEEKVLKNGRITQVKAKGTLKQRIIITFSRKMMEYQRHIRNAQIERAINMLNTENYKIDVLKSENKEYMASKNNGDDGNLSTGIKYSSRIVVCAKDYIEDNYMKDISIKDIADHLYLTPNYVSLLFKQEMNITVMAYVTQLRMKEAVRLLKDNNLRVCEVADAVGYKDANHFSKLFKKYFGYNPSDFRFTQHFQQSEDTI
jgi:YesN/AraC family two-component response regulator